MNRNLAWIGVLILVAISTVAAVAESSAPARITLGAVDLAACVCFHPLTADYILLKRAIKEKRGGIVRVLPSASELNLRLLEDRLDEVDDLLDRVGAGETEDETGPAAASPEESEKPRMVSIDLTDYIMENEELGEPEVPIDVDRLTAERYSLLEKVEKTRSEVRYIHVPEAEKQLETLRVTIKGNVMAALRDSCRETGVDLGVNFAHASINMNRPLVHYAHIEPAAEAGSEPAVEIAVVVSEDPSLMLHYSEIFWNNKNEDRLRERLGHELSELPLYLSLFGNYIGTRLFMRGEKAAPFKGIFLTELVIGKLLQKYRIKAEKAQVVKELLVKYFDSAAAEEEMEDVR